MRCTAYTVSPCSNMADVHDGHDGQRQLREQVGRQALRVGDEQVDDTATTQAMMSRKISGKKACQFVSFILYFRGASMLQDSLETDTCFSSSIDRGMHDVGERASGRGP